jgi:proteic killer suppression protein
MITSFKHKGLELFFTQDDKHLLENKQVKKISILLDALDGAEKIEDLNTPGTRLHPLSGSQKNLWRMRVSENEWLTFGFYDSKAFDVNFEETQ